MAMLFKYLISSITQILLFSIVPFVWWLVTARKEVSFTHWIGLKKIQTDNKQSLALWIAGVTLIFAVFGALVLHWLDGVATAASSFKGMRWHALPALLLYAIFNTALPEELLFRGFLLKRLQHRLAFKVANTLQAIVFGLLHGVMFVSVTGLLKAFVIVLLTSAIAALMGSINEQKAGGSIYPSWIIHAVSNIVSGLYVAFELI